MFTTTIKWTVYDGTAKTRPHNLRQDYCDLSDKHRATMAAPFMLKCHAVGRIENQAFFLRVKERYNEKKSTYVFDGWFWQSAWLTAVEDHIRYALEVGDMWAPWPGIAAIEGQPDPQPQSESFRMDAVDMRTGLRRAMQAYTDSPALLDALEQFRVMRDRIKKPMTGRALQLILKDLDTLSGGDESAKIAILEQSIVNSWRGVFALKAPLSAARRAATGQQGNTRPDGKPRDYGQSDFGALGN